MKIAMAQMACVQSEKNRNVAHVLQLLDRATAFRADLVVLPECSDLGWLADAACEEAEPIDGPFITKVREWAREHSIWISIGWTERDKNHVYNAAVLIDCVGRPVLHHRKIHVLDIAQHLYRRGTSLRVVDTEFGRIGMDICADSWVDHNTKAMADMGAWLVVSPCAWASPAGKEEETSLSHQKHYQDRTTERDIVLVGVSGVGDLTEGPWAGQLLQGNSLAYGPGGRQLCRGQTSEEEVLTIDVSPPGSTA
jgi:predicted amidohydrolase